MKLYYEDTDITDDVDIVSAVHRDVSGGRSDCLELTLDHAATWNRWKPQIDDSIELAYNGYTTGRLFLNTILPEGDRYRILATGARRSAQRKAWAAFEGKTLGEIAKLCAAECRMEHRLYGVSEQYAYPYLLRRNESCPAFLSRIAQMEGAVLKTYGGRLTMISIAAAQELPALSTLVLGSRQEGVRYMRREGAKLASLTVRTPYTSASATDSSAQHGPDESRCELPATDAATAGRWARGLLLAHNRQCEKLDVQSEINIGYTAMTRIDVESEMDYGGRWIIDEAEHDFVNKKSRISLLRVIDTVE
jgi:phage protein D